MLHSQLAADLGCILSIMGFVIVPVLWLWYLDYKAKRGE